MHELSDTDRKIADASIDRRPEQGRFDVDARRGKLGAGGLGLRLRLPYLCAERIDTPLRGKQSGLSTIGSLARLSCLRLKLGKPLAASGAEPRRAVPAPV